MKNQSKNKKLADDNPAVLLLGAVLKKLLKNKSGAEGVFFSLIAALSVMAYLFAIIKSFVPISLWAIMSALLIGSVVLVMRLLLFVADEHFVWRGKSMIIIAYSALMLILSATAIDKSSSIGIVLTVLNILSAVLLYGTLIYDQFTDDDNPVKFWLLYGGAIYKVLYALVNLIVGFVSPVGVIAKLNTVFAGLCAIGVVLLLVYLFDGFSFAKYMYFQIIDAGGDDDEIDSLADASENQNNIDNNITDGGIESYEPVRKVAAPQDSFDDGEDAEYTLYVPFDGDENEKNGDDGDEKKDSCDIGDAGSDTDADTTDKEDIETDVFDEVEEDDLADDGDDTKDFEDEEYKDPYVGEIQEYEDYSDEDEEDAEEDNPDNNDENTEENIEQAGYIAAYPSEPDDYTEDDKAEVDSIEPIIPEGDACRAGDEDAILHSENTDDSYEENETQAYDGIAKRAMAPAAQQAQDDMDNNKSDKTPAAVAEREENDEGPEFISPTELRYVRFAAAHHKPENTLQVTGMSGDLFDVWVDGDTICFLNDFEQASGGRGVRSAVIPFDDVSGLGFDTLSDGTECIVLTYERSGQTREIRFTKESFPNFKRVLEEAGKE